MKSSDAREAIWNKVRRSIAAWPLVLMLVFIATCGGEPGPEAAEPPLSPHEHLIVTTVVTASGFDSGDPDRGDPLPLGIALDHEGNVFIAERNTIWRRMRGGEMELLAGGPERRNRGPDIVDGPVASARLGSTGGVAVDARGNLYFTENGTQRLRVITPEGVIRTLAGGGELDHWGVAEEGFRDGPGPDARFAWPAGVVFDEQHQRLLVADAGNGRVRVVSLSGEVSTLAGDGRQLLDDNDRDGYFDEDDGPAETASFRAPGGIAVDRHGAIYVINDRGNLRRIDPSGSVSTILDGYKERSAGPLPRIGVRGVVAGADGSIYFTGYDYIARLTPDGEVEIIAGMGELEVADTRDYRHGYVDGLAREARFWCPVGLALDTDGSLLIADTCNGVIRRLAPMDGDLAESRRECEAESVTDNAHAFRRLTFSSIPDEARNGFAIETLVATSDLVVVASIAGVEGAVISPDDSFVLLRLVVEDVLYGLPPSWEDVSALLPVPRGLLDHDQGPVDALRQVLPQGQTLLSLRIVDDWGRREGLRGRDGFVLEPPELGGGVRPALFMAIPEGTWLETDAGGFVGTHYPAELLQGAPCSFTDLAEQFRATGRESR